MSIITIKTPEEQNLMREGGKILSACLDHVTKLIKPGISTLEIDRAAEAFIRSFPGATPAFKGYKGFPGTLCMSINEEVVHGIPSDKKILRDGDIVGVDSGVLFGGLYTDAARTAAVGKCSSQSLRLIEATERALSECLSAVKPGNRIGDISAIIEKVLRSYGFSPVVRCTGHGVGRRLHEPPDILNAGIAGTGPLIKPGMTLAIEPISSMGSGRIKTAKDGWTVITEERLPSAHFEVTVLVTEKGFEVIT